MLRLRPSILLAAGAALLSACVAVGNVWDYVTTERPPYALRAVGLASDIRLDSNDVIVGTLVGSGTDERVTLLSSDTGFIAELAGRARPRLGGRSDDIWGWLANAGTVMVPIDRVRGIGNAPGVEVARVASPYGHSNVELQAIRLRGSSCGWRGARAELVVSGPLHGSRAPSLRGPVVGSFRPGSPDDARAWRDAPPRPSSTFEDELVARTVRDMDSLLALRLPRSALPLSAPRGQRLVHDPLEDIDAAEVLPLWSGQGRIRYAVAIRVERDAANGDDLLASTVMIWDSTGAWRQSVLAPTVVETRRGMFRPWRDELPLYWGRLDAAAGFGLDRDYLIVEQVDVDRQSVYWGAIEARTNAVVAAAEVGGACTDDVDERGRGRGRHLGWDRDR